MYNKVFMLEALSQAAQSPDAPFGAVIACDGQFIGKAGNRVISNQDPTAHAEMLAIREACRKWKTYDLRGCDMYLSSMACPMCTAAIKLANIDNVYYAAKTKDAESIGFNDARMWIKFREPSENIIPEFHAVGDWCEVAAREIMQDWGKNQKDADLIKFLDNTGVPRTDINVGITCSSVCGYYYIYRLSESEYRVSLDFNTVGYRTNFIDAVDLCNKNARSE